MNTSVQSRFDTRLPKEQKEFFEYVATIGGYRTLTEFMIASAQEKAGHIHFLGSSHTKRTVFLT